MDLDTEHQVAFSSGPGAACPRSQRPGPTARQERPAAPCRPKRGGFILSLDFEMMWGVRSGANHAAYRGNVLGAREAIPALLDLFEAEEIACTWAVVGLLCFANRAQLLAALPSVRPAYEIPSLSSYSYLDELGDCEASDPLHFGRSLVERISARTRQEIGSHSFSHYLPLDADPSGPALAADLEAARKVAEGLGVTLSSFAFPRNQVTPDALAICREAGFQSYRGAAPGWFNRPARSGRTRRLTRFVRLLDSYIPLTDDVISVLPIEHDLVNVRASRLLRPYSPRLAAFESLKLARIFGSMRKAARRGHYFHLWFHPHNFGKDLDRNLATMRAICAEANRLNRVYGWPSLTMSDAASAMSDSQPVARNGGI